MNWCVRSAQNGSTITHYGVKGMRWGVRKAYEPVGRKKKLSANKKPPSAGDYSRYDEYDSENRERYGFERVVRNQNGTTTLKIIGTNTIDSFEELINNKDKAEDFGYLSESEAIKVLKELPKIEKSGSESYERYAVNQDAPITERLSNCFECTLATEMRARGYDVQANTKQGGLRLEYHHAFDIKDTFNITSQSTEEAYRLMEIQCLQYGEGARGAIGVSWLTGSGHAINWKVENGEFIIFDNQKLGRDTYADFLNCDPSNISVVRLDNAEVLPGVVDYIEAYDGLTEEEIAEEEARKKREKKEVQIARASREDMKKRRENARQERLARENYEKFINNRSIVQKVKNAIVKVAKATVDKISEYASKGAKYIKDFFNKL